MITPTTAPDAIRIRGARANNLRNVDLDIPRGKLVVLTGPSGSGKSSLAFDTLFAEGQRQYIESLSTYARQFLRQLERPDVDLIDGMQPTVCIDQRPWANNPRSTVATVTEIYDYLRLLMARLGEASCPACGAPIRQQSVEQIHEQLMDLPEGTKSMIMAPLVRGRRGKHEEALDSVRKAGLVRVRIDGEVLDLERVEPLEPRRAHDIDAVVDRVIIRESVRDRVGESLRLALGHGGGQMVVCYHDAAADAAHPTGQWRDLLFSTRNACPQCQTSFSDLEPRTFSFNSPYGACPDCEGLGLVEQFDPELIIADASAPIDSGALAPWRHATASAAKKLRKQLDSFLSRAKIEPTAAMASYSDAAMKLLMHGDKKAKFPGLLVLLEKEWATATQAARREELAAFRDRKVCRGCDGSRLRPEAASVRLHGLAIHEITRLNVARAAEFFGQLEFSEAHRPIAQPILTEIRSRLAFLEKVGANYLTLDRPADTLSGGELQRVRLATNIGSGLVGVCYVLDEPSIGLHQRDNDRLIRSLRDLQEQGNTVLVVEHDEAMMREADLLVDIGPGAGAAGGRVVAVGAVDQIVQQTESSTGAFLSGRARIEVPTRRPVSRSKSKGLTLLGAATNNLRGADVRFPLGAFVGVTGVSGSGKSSLVNETLARAVRRRLGGGGPKPGPHQGLRGVSQIDKLVEIDQSPIGRTPRSNAATYTGLFDEIRKIFSGTRDARQRGYRSSRFSFNVKGGRCEHCQGQGVQRIEMHFLADIYVECSVCRGARFNRQTLQVRYRGMSIADVLRMSVAEAIDFFASFSQLARTLAALGDVGLGYLPLGQPSTTLSGGEAQRVKLATQLARAETGQTLYLLDEPTTGLHFGDVRCLLHVLQQLVDRGNTVILIEHNLDVIKCVDWLIDIGPEGGEHGGHVVAEGTPEEVAEVASSHTGRYLREWLRRADPPDPPRVD